MTIKKCSIEGCSNNSRSWGMCSKHFQRARKFGDPNIRHRQAKGETGFACTVPGCDKPHKAKGFCYVHYQRFKRFGDPNIVKRNLNGEGTVNSDGYRKITLADGSRINEHRFIMEQCLGRKLRRTEVVHHIDGNRLNNSIENLMLFKNHAEHLNHCHEIPSAFADGNKQRWSSKTTGDSLQNPLK